MDIHSNSFPLWEEAGIWVFSFTHSVLNLEGRYYSECHPESPTLFLLVSVQQDYARYHQHSKAGKSEASPLGSPQKSCGIRQQSNSCTPLEEAVSCGFCLLTL